MKKNEALPMHVQFFRPILDVLRELGGSATTTELKDKLVEKLNISEEDIEEKLKTGAYRIDNQISWSKVYLSKSGLIQVSDSGVWSLTEDGFKKEPDDSEILSNFKKIQSSFFAKRGKKKQEKESDAGDVAIIEEEKPHKVELFKILRELPPVGFERLCQRLLRASGFEKVEVKGRSGDGGIDGEGILEINPLVSLKVIFQSKRYKDAVSASQIRDFRGAMQGRAEKGIFITTGRFTSDAKAEAMRVADSPIELVDGDKLVKLFEQKLLGLKQKVVYEVDRSFFDEYC